MRSTGKYEDKVRKLESELSNSLAAVEELKLLNEIALAAGETTNIDDTLRLILDKTVKAIGAEHGAILLVSKKEEVLKTLFKQDYASRLTKYPHLGEHLTGWVLLNKKSLLVTELNKDRRFNITEEERAHIKSLICSPIWFEGNIIGVMQMINRKTGSEKTDKEPLCFSENELTLLSIISVQAGQLIKNSELQQLNFEKKKEAEVARLDNEKLRELDRIKTNFFTNLSHEFRTPLTLILGPLEKLLDEEKNRNNDKLKMIFKNANRMHRLINQLLDLSSIDAGKMKLNLEKGDVLTLIKGIAASFRPLAEIKNTTIYVDSGMEPLITCFDRDKLEKILSNLLINAVKYTAEGSIKVVVPDQFQMRKNWRYFRIIIEDTGSGIPGDKIKNVFDRFYTDRGKFENKIPAGTGIGLALVKELVELLEGCISVENKEDKGTKFTIELPFDEGYYQSIGVQINSDSKEGQEIHKMPSFPTGLASIGEEMPQVLIVEDNEDIRNFLKQSIEATMQVIESSNGREGLEQAEAYIPDLIISDVLMPEMDGIELCRKLKTDEKTSHIPVVLLSSRSAVEDKLEGLETGADDYITKPFNVAELQIRINNLILQRKKLRQRYRKEIFSDVKEVAITSTDERFLNRVYRTIEKHISDYNFTVEEFAKEIGLSRMQLHRKLVALTDQSANDLIRSYRLKQAARLLICKSGNISEVAYEVGFSNPSYFAACFKELFGSSPSEYLLNFDSIQEN